MISGSADQYPANPPPKHLVNHFLVSVHEAKLGVNANLSYLIMSKQFRQCRAIRSMGKKSMYTISIRTNEPWLPNGSRIACHISTIIYSVNCLPLDEQLNLCGLQMSYRCLDEAKETFLCNMARKDAAIFWSRSFRQLKLCGFSALSEIFDFSLNRLLQPLSLLPISWRISFTGLRTDRWQLIQGAVLFLWSVLLVFCFVFSILLS